MKSREGQQLSGMVRELRVLEIETEKSSLRLSTRCRELRVVSEVNRRIEEGGRLQPSNRVRVIEGK